MISNLLLRFYWVISIFQYDYKSLYISNVLKDWDVLVLTSVMAEAIRRTQWALIRVENEFFNNFEQYRSISIAIPELIGYIDKIDKKKLEQLKS